MIHCRSMCAQGGIASVIRLVLIASGHPGVGGVLFFHFAPPQLSETTPTFIARFCLCLTGADLIASSDVVPPAPTAFPSEKQVAASLAGHCVPAAPVKATEKLRPTTFPLDFSRRLTRGQGEDKRTEDHIECNEMLLAAGDDSWA